MADDQQQEEDRSYPFCVDTWNSPKSSLYPRKRRHYFLTHAHLDHTRGLSPFFSPIFCTDATARLVLLRHPQMHRSAFSIIELEEPRLIQDEDTGSFTVTAYDANHCPGAVMFLFEGSFGTVLHTGDCRLTLECFGRLPRRLFGGSVDLLFLDCTFGKEAVRMPNREDAIKQVKQCVWNHPDAPIVYLACDLLGQELLLRSLFCAFGCKIFVDKHNLPEFYGCLKEVAHDLITDDPRSTRLHVCEGFPRLYEKAKKKFAAAYAKGEAEPLFIRLSAQWYTYGERLEGVGSGLLLLEKMYEKGPSLTRRRVKSVPTEAERDPFGIWHVCYSMHSSRDELELFVSKLKPRQVISTTPQCKATELSYVRTLVASAAHDRVVSKIISMPLKMVEESKAASESVKGESGGQPEDSTEPLLVQVTSPIRHIPLFGPAVAGLIPSPPLSFYSSSDDDDEGSSGNSLEQDTNTVRCSSSSNDNPQSTVPSNVSRCLHSSQSPAQKDNAGTPCNEAKQGSSSEKDIEETFGAWGSPRYWKAENREGSVHSSSLVIEHMTGLGETTRRMYRSLNMMIPRPLPSLLELDRDIKRGRF